MVIRLFSPILCNYFFINYHSFDGRATVLTVEKLDGMVDTAAILPRPDEEVSLQSQPITRCTMYWAQFILQHFDAKLMVPVSPDYSHLGRAARIICLPPDSALWVVLDWDILEKLKVEINSDCPAKLNKCMAIYNCSMYAIIWVQSPWVGKYLL